MRISDWSSDVCSSDLKSPEVRGDHPAGPLLDATGHRAGRAVSGLRRSGFPHRGDAGGGWRPLRLSGGGGQSKRARHFSPGPLVSLLLLPRLLAVAEELQKEEEKDQRSEGRRVGKGWG